MSLPEVSIITANYNHEKWIERCIRSIQNQVHIPLNQIEHIIVDDASTDNSRVIIEKHLLPNIVYIKNKENIGLPSSLNKGIRLAKGRYILRVDSDDYIGRDFVYIHKLFLDLNRKFHAVSADYVLVNDSEEALKIRRSENDFIACGILFRKEVLIELGMYNEEFKYREGHELIKRFRDKDLTMGYSNFPLYKYRMHEMNRSRNEEIQDYDKKLEQL